MSHAKYFTKSFSSLTCFCSTNKPIINEVCLHTLPLFFFCQFIDIGSCLLDLLCRGMLNSQTFVVSLFCSRLFICQESMFTTGNCLINNMPDSFTWIIGVCKNNHTPLFIGMLNACQCFFINS